MNLLLEPRELRILAGLRLRPRRRFAGSVRGERMTQAKGISIEFADYREYAEGDDLRHLDWNVLARLGHPVTKTYRDEEDLAVHLLVDCSSSMGFGEPGKMETAKKLASALGYIALGAGDTVYPRALSGPASPPSFRGRSAVPRLAHWLSHCEPSGGRGLTDEVRQFVTGSGRQGVAVFVTDGLHPDAATAVKALAGRGHEVWLLQVLSDAELDPDLEGDLRLVDSENARTAEVTINSFSLRAYRDKLAAHNDSLAAACLRSGGRYSLVVSGTRVENVVRDVWQREGWVE